MLVRVYIAPDEFQGDAQVSCDECVLGVMRTFLKKGAMTEKRLENAGLKHNRLGLVCKPSRQSYLMHTNPTDPLIPAHYLYTRVMGFKHGDIG